MSGSASANYNLILTHEQQFARAVGARVVEKPQISVWMFLFPIILVPYMQRYQQYQAAVEVSADGYLYTKRLALDTALRVLNRELRPEDAVADAAARLNQEDPPDENLSGVREKQIKEVELLIDHYGTLLQSTGKDYGSLLKGAYKYHENYARFLDRLEQREKAVNQSSIEVFSIRVKNLPDTIRKMETALADLRRDEARKYLPPNP